MSNSMLMALVIGRCLATVACVIVGGYLAVNGKEGWGWFLFVAVLMAPSFSSGDEDIE